MQKILTAGEIMNPAVVTVQDDWTIQELATFLIERGISGAPVANEKGKLVGVVSNTDLAESAAEVGAAPPEVPPAAPRPLATDRKLTRAEMDHMHVEHSGLLVRDIMTPTLYTIPAETPVPEIARTMIAGRIHRLLVTRNHQVVGIITTLDLLKLLL
jgi:CBS domain-containing protein